MSYDALGLDSEQTEPAEVEASGSGLDLRMTLHKLEVFCRVVDAGGVTRAAEVLFLTQPVVTGHIRSLEERLGVKLFSRSGRHNILTDAGERTYRRGQEILRLARELHRELEELKDGSRGSAAIAASMSAGSYLLPPLIARFKRMRPDVQISLSVSGYTAAQEAVQVGKADFAVTIGDPPAGLDWLSCEVIGVEELVLVAAPDSDLGEAPLGHEELSELPFVESLMSGRRELAARHLREYGVERLNIVMELGHPEAMKRAVEQGAGVALLFGRSVREDVARGQLRQVPIEGADLAFPVLLLTRRDKEMSSAQTELIQQIRDECAASSTLEQLA